MASTPVQEHIAILNRYICNNETMKCNLYIITYPYINMDVLPWHVHLYANCITNSITTIEL